MHSEAVVRMLGANMEKVSWFKTKHFSVDIKVPESGIAEKQILTDEVDCDWRELGLAQSIIESFLFNAALDVRIQHNAGQFRILNHALERHEQEHGNTAHRWTGVYTWSYSVKKPRSKTSTKS